jgi:hypothetical protein
MNHSVTKSKTSHREKLGNASKTAAASVALAPPVQSDIVSCAAAAENAVPDAAPLNGVAGIDRVTILPPVRRTFGYRPAMKIRRVGATASAWRAIRAGACPDLRRPEIAAHYATFTAPGAYVLKLTVDNGQNHRVFGNYA